MTLNEIERIQPTRELITPSFQWDAYEQHKKTIPPNLLRYRLNRWQQKHWGWLWQEYKYFYETFVEDQNDEVLSFLSFSRISFICLVFHAEREVAVSREIERMVN